MAKRKFSSARASRRQAEREQTKQKSSHTFKNRSAFEKIKPTLQMYGWKYFSNHTDGAIVDSKNVVSDQRAALVLKNNDYAFTICEYCDGVRVGKMEIWKKTENKVEAASILAANVINFLIKNEVTNIYAFTEFLGHVKEEDVILNQVELEEMFSGIGFVKSGSNGRLIFSDPSKLKKIEAFDEKILLGDAKNDDAGDNSVYFKGQTQVYFEFEGNQSKNFTRAFYVGTDDEIKTELRNFIKKIKDDNEESHMIKSTLNAVLQEKSAIPDQLLNYLGQSLIGVLLAKAAKENDYQAKMTEISFHIIPFLHLINNGNEKRYFQYKLLFNEKRETLDIAVRSYDKKTA